MFQYHLNNFSQIIMANKDKPVDKKVFSEWMVGMMVQTFNVSLTDRLMLEKIMKAKEEIIRFGDQYEIFRKDFK